MNISSILCPVHREGWLYVGLFAAATFLAFNLSVHFGWIFLILTAWCAYFFRDPVRTVPQRKGLLISPADGLVQTITRRPLPPEAGMGEGTRLCISIFMNVFDVHINRAPHDGTIKSTHYVPGKFLNASLDKASADNERMIYVMTLPDGKELVIVQIAGLVARRIVPWAKPNDVVTAGDRIGMIRFGSRVDLYLPDGASPLVSEGQKSLAGETVLVDLDSTEGARKAERK